MHKFCQSNTYISFYDIKTKLRIMIYREGDLIEIDYNNMRYNISKSTIKINNNKITIYCNIDIKIKTKIINVFNLLIVEINKLNNKETLFFNEKIKLEELMVS
jgi:hypothetical protein